MGSRNPPRARNPEPTLEARLINQYHAIISRRRSDMLRSDGSRWEVDVREKAFDRAVEDETRERITSIRDILERECKGEGEWQHCYGM